MPDLKTLGDELVEHHRRRDLTPLAVLETRARLRRRRRRLGAVAAAAASAAAITAAVVAIPGGGHRQTVVITSPPSPPTTLVTPAGWSRVSYNDSSIAAPSNWTLVTGVECPNPQYAVLLGDAQEPGKNCGAQFPMGPPMQAYARLQPLTSAPPAGTPIEVNGHAGVETTPGPDTHTYYLPDLSLTLTLAGAKAAPIIKTVGWSPEYLLLHPTRPVEAPSNWKQVRYQTIAFKVPPTWPVKPLGPTDHMPGICTYPEFTSPVVDEGTGGTTTCNGFHPYSPVTSIDGVWVRPYMPLPHQAFPPPGSTILHSTPTTLTVLATRNNGQQIAQLVAGQPGHQIAIDIGLGPNPLIAQQVLASIR